jgi:hypothetical protein
MEAEAEAEAGGGGGGGAQGRRRGRGQFSWRAGASRVASDTGDGGARDARGPEAAVAAAVRSEGLGGGSACRGASVGARRSLAARRQPAAGPGTSHKLGAAPPRRQPSCRSHVCGAAIGSGSKPVGQANGTLSRSAQPPKAMPLE